MSRNEALHFINVAHFFDHYFLLIFPTAALAIGPAWDMAFADVLMLGSPIYIMLALGTLPVGWLGDRVDRMALMAAFFLGCGASSVFVATSQTSLAMSIGLGALGLFAAIYHPIGLAHITHVGLRTGRALAVNGVFGNMGLACAAAVTGFLATFAGWRAAFYVPGVLSFVLGCVLLIRCRVRHRSPLPSVSPTADRPHTVNRKTQMRVFLIICVSALCGGLVFNTVTIALPKFFDERLIGLGGDLAWISASTGAIFGVAAFAQLPVGELLDRIGARSVLIPLIAGQIACLVLLTQATGISALVLAFLLVTMIFAEIPITTWLLGQFLEPHVRSRAVSVEYALSLAVGAVVIPVLVGLTDIGIGFDGQFLVLAGAGICLLIAALFLPGTRPTALTWTTCPTSTTS